MPKALTGREMGRAVPLPSRLGVWGASKTVLVHFQLERTHNYDGNILFGVTRAVVTSIVALITPSLVWNVLHRMWKTHYWFDIQSHHWFLHHFVYDVPEKNYTGVGGLCPGPLGPLDKRAVAKTHWSWVLWAAKLPTSVPTSRDPD